MKFIIYGLFGFLSLSSPVCAERGASNDYVESLINEVFRIVKVHRGDKSSLRAKVYERLKKETRTHEVALVLAEEDLWNLWTKGEQEEFIDILSNHLICTYTDRLVERVDSGVKILKPREYSYGATVKVRFTTPPREGESEVVENFHVNFYLRVDKEKDLWWVRNVQLLGLIEVSFEHAIRNKIRGWKEGVAEEERGEVVLEKVRKEWGREEPCY